jgi:Fur family transcriptional regulator, ferric uptake regulator
VRITKQRQVLLEILCGLTNHPSADDLYLLLRERMPRISLGSVYRNLEILSDEGFIQKLDVAGVQKRFDGNPHNHYHVRCQECGQVDDLDLPLKNDVEEEASRLSDYKILRHSLEFIGICPQCRRKRDHIEG